MIRGGGRITGLTIPWGNCLHTGRAGWQARQRRPLLGQPLFDVPQLDERYTGL